MKIVEYRCKLNKVIAYTHFCVTINIQFIYLMEKEIFQFKHFITHISTFQIK